MKRMEKWVKTWIDQERKNGRKRIEIKKSHNAHYVYDSTTVWNKELKKRKKCSKYVGRLDRERGLIKSSKSVVSRIVPRSIWHYGNAIILNHALETILPVLKQAFPNTWEELYALALVRITGYVPLKRVKLKWEQLFNVRNIEPILEPAHLSEILRLTGIDRKAQNTVFSTLMGGQHYAFDLSAIFTRSAMNIADLGHNKLEASIPQVNLVLLSSVDQQLPSMVRVVPGSIRDVSTLITSLSDMKMSEITLVLDTGFFSDDNMKAMSDLGMRFVLPTRRNSLLYEKIGKEMGGHFFYRERLIKHSKVHDKDVWLYLFEDTKLKEEEEKTLYRRFDEGKLNKEEFAKSLAKAGQILMVSNSDMDAKNIFGIYKQREGVEQQFDTFKNTLQADILYLQDDESMFGHIFASFLSLYGYSVLQNLLRKAEILDRVSPTDLIEELSTVYAISDGEKEIITEVRKKTRILVEKLGTDLFPKLKS